MHLKKLFLLILVLVCNAVNGQDSCRLRISLLTCSPGEELYSTFGHSALRVTDSVSGQDIVYNYGTFNFEEPGFYTKFIRGKLLYYLSTENFFSFAELYRQQSRSITEQVINLSCKEEEEVIQFLSSNMLPENRSYKYDFLFDNCTTRLRDLAEKVADTTLVFNRIVERNTKFRDLIHLYLDSNKQHWSKLGIDLLLGSRTDAIMENREAMFLPDYLLLAFDKALSGKKRLVADKTILFKAGIPSSGNGFLSLPLFYSSLLLIIVMLLSFSKKASVQSGLKNFDAMLLFIVGLLGTLMLFMWFGTDHIMCSDNYNLLWAWPTHTIAAFFINRKLSWVKTYLLAMIIIYFLLLLSWPFLPQKLNVALVPVILVMLLRGGMRFREMRNFRV